MNYDNKSKEELIEELNRAQQKNSALTNKNERVDCFDGSAWAKFSNSDTFLNTFIDNNPNSIWISDDKGTLIRINKACCKLFNVIEEEVIDKYNIFSDNIVIEKGLVPLIKKVFDNHETIRFEIQYDMSDLKNIDHNATNWLYLEARIFPIIDPSGNLTNLVVQHNDITERYFTQKELNQKINDLKRGEEVAKFGYWNYYTDKSILSSSKGARIIYGFENEILSLAEAQNAVLPEYREKLNKALSDLISYGTPYDVDFKILRKTDGKIIDVHSKAEYDPTQKIVFGIIQDITARKKVEEALIESEQEIKSMNCQLQKTIDEKDKFFSIMAHDLRSPFQGFLNLTKRMAEEMHTITMKELQYFGTILQNSAKNIFELIENLLEWSKMQRGLIVFNPELLALPFIVKHNIEIFSEFAKNKNIKITSNIPENYWVTADVPMLNSILRNLISNAIKFTHKNGKIEIGIVEHSNALEADYIYVKDNGIGMSGDIIGNLFRIDKKVSTPGTEGESSTGLGLLLCMEFIEKHDGKIWVESEVGKGSTFYFTLK